MSEVLEFYQNAARDKASCIDGLSELRQSGLEALDKFGFPTRHDEAWKYSAPNAWMKQRFHLSAHTAGEALINDDCPVGIKINAQTAELMSGLLPSRLVILPLLEALQTHPELVKPYLGQIQQQNDGFTALNNAMAEQGLFIYIPEGLVLDEPIVLMHQSTAEHQARYQHHLVLSAPRSAATLVEDYQGQAGLSYFTNTITEIRLEKNASLTHIKLQRESRAAFHVGRLFVHQSERSSFKSHSFSLGGQWVRSDIDIRLSEAHADCLMNGIYLPAGTQHIDHHTYVHHEVADCHSEQDYKGVMSSRARAVFDGKVIVSPQAVRSVAHQQNKNLLLSSESEIDTKPELEIFADDVVCSHGATVGQLSDEALFYLAARGIPTDEAKMLLISAFAADNVARIEQPALLTWLRQLLLEQLELFHGCRAV